MNLKEISDQWNIRYWELEVLSGKPIVHCDARTTTDAWDQMEEASANSEVREAAKIRYEELTIETCSLEEVAEILVSESIKDCIDFVEALLQKYDELLMIALEEAGDDEERIKSLLDMKPQRKSFRKEVLKKIITLCT